MAPAVRPSTPGRGGERMSWETPTFVEVRMDAEINSYQDEFDPEPSEPF
jgi:coenzyme PQQ precursor peptide PqqA